MSHPGAGASDPLASVRMDNERELLLVGGQVVLPDRTVIRADLRCAGGRIVAILDPVESNDHTDHPDPADPADQHGLRSAAIRSEQSAPSSEVLRLDVTGHLVAPGYLDLQLNGGFGHDVTSDARCIPELARMLPRTGVTGFLPTVVTAPPVARERALDVMAALAPHQPDGADLDPRAARPIGLHFEGPVLSLDRRGAHRAEHLGMPEEDELLRWTRAAGLALVTLAPEVPGALALAARLVAAGVTVSIGHTGCTPAEFATARAAGATYVTHLFNAMAPFSHRSPGPIGAALADPGVVAGIICDGIHVDPTAVAMAWQALGPDRTSLVTDAVAALGIDAETLTLGGREIRIGSDGVRTPEGVLAGSNLALDQAVRNLVAFTGCSPAEAIGTVTTVPARLLGLPDRGRLEVGARADLVVLDAGLHPRWTIVGGTVAFHDPTVSPGGHPGTSRP